MYDLPCTLLVAFVCGNPWWLTCSTDGLYLHGLLLSYNLFCDWTRVTKPWSCSTMVCLHSKIEYDAEFHTLLTWVATAKVVAVQMCWPPKPIPFPDVIIWLTTQGIAAEDRGSRIWPWHSNITWDWCHSVLIWPWRLANSLIWSRLFYSRHRGPQRVDMGVWAPVSESVSAGNRLIIVGSLILCASAIHPTHLFGKKGHQIPKKLPEAVQGARKSQWHPKGAVRVDMEYEQQFLTPFRAWEGGKSRNQPLNSRPTAQAAHKY